MNKCYKCGEYAKCREKIFWKHEILNMNLSQWICEPCDIAEKIEDERDLREARIKRRKNQKAWIKKRDKILKEAGE